MTPGKGAASVSAGGDREKVARANLKGGEIGDLDRGEHVQEVVARGEGGGEEARLTEGRQHSRPRRAGQRERQRAESEQQRVARELLPRGAQAAAREKGGRGGARGRLAWRPVGAGGGRRPP